MAQSDQQPKIKVLLMGSFHFAQTDSSYDVLNDQHQKSIEDLCKIIAKQKPAKIFVERQPEYEFRNKIDSLYQIYVKKNQFPGKNEIYQVGFRLAKKLGHSKVYQCDHPGQYGRYYRQVNEYAAANNQEAVLAGEKKGAMIRYDELVNEDSIMQNSSLLDYLKWINSEKVMSTSHASYITNYTQIGSTDFYNYDDDDTLIGAELTADWYRRNIMIYAKVINQVAYDEPSILILIGADHVPILEYLFETNPYFEVVAASEWLK